MTGYFHNLDISRYLADLAAVGIPLSAPLVGIDDGYDQIKAAYWVVENGVARIEETKIKSRARRGRHITGFMGNGVGLYATGDDDVYTVGDNLDGEDTRTDDYPKTALNRCLVHAILNRIGLTNNIEVAIATGLPLRAYMSKEGGTNDRLIDAKKINMAQPVTVGMDKRPSARIVFNTIFPEAISGIADYLMSETGAVRDGLDVSAVRMALDIGGNTTDMAIIMNGSEVHAMETIKFGVSHMRDRLKSLIEDDLELTLDTLSLDEALNTRKASIFGEDKDVSIHWQRAVADVLSDIFTAADRLRSKYPSIREMVAFGGGAALCRDVISVRYPNVRLVEKPDGANARGYLKFGSFDAIDQINERISAARAGQAEAAPL